MNGADSAPRYLPCPVCGATDRVCELDAPKRLEELRAEIRAERISWGELYELQTLARHIDPSDVELLQWAGVRVAGASCTSCCTYCGADDGEPCNADCLSRVEPVVAP